MLLLRCASHVSNRARIPLNTATTGALIALVLLFWACGITHAGIPDNGIVCIDANHCLRGNLSGGSAYSFLGILYAAPPTGELRFRPPADPVWTGLRSASAFGPPCARRTDTGVVTGSEDCLTLNLWAPVTGSQHPVIVFIHPGLNSRGGARMGMAGYGGLTFTTAWDGEPWAATYGIVFVSVEYRVNAFGFLAHPSLSAEDPNGSSGNYGMLDQIKALQWVQENVASFGGDPSNVTILGATAGAADASVLLVSDLAKGLFSHAILESPVWSRFPTLQEAEHGVGAMIVKGVGCAGTPDVAACLRAKSVAEILQASPFGRPSTESEDYAPRIDGWLLKSDPIDLVEGDLAPSKVPVIIGSTADEFNAHARDSDVVTTVFFGLQKTSHDVSSQDYANAITTQFGDTIGAQVLSLYPDSEFQQSPLLQLPEAPSASFAAMLRVLTDWEFTCPVRALARNASTGGRTVYRYFFTHAIENNAIMQKLGAFDNEDNWFLFTPSYTYSVDERALSNTMRAYWAAFAATGNPNGGSRPTWPAYEHSAHNDNFLQLDTTGIIAGNGVRTGECDFWNSLDRKLHGRD
jgi:para-nitrobenzyl esterase